MEPKKTPLHQKHIQEKGRIIDFAGWLLPVEYRSMLSEAKAARISCGIFDASHMGELLVKGPRAVDFLQKLTSNDISSLAFGRMQYNLLLNEDAGIIDDLMVYRKEKDLLCVVNASNKDKALAWLMKNSSTGIVIEDVSSKTALISLQGPTAHNIIREVFGRDFEELRYMFFLERKIEGRDILVSRSGYTAEDGFEIYTDWDEAGLWWDKFVSAGKKYGLTFCGLGARDILRIEAGYPLYGHEIDEEINPYEASLGWAVKLERKFMARDKLLKIREKELKRKRVGFIMQSRALVRQGYPVYSGASKIGEVTSGTYSPNLERFIGMAYVGKDYARIGTKISVEVRGKHYEAEIAKFSFIGPKTKKNSFKEAA
ncbi:MAG: glycine cleavage system aminomethyltransferase GcvT [Candidatus Omnitrophica bacterium]|nr:glycine cleavage system aminomethyltransferase GcvT [Candidatus Omnitrophota bacterium]MDD5430529.1 glycine cleavage system aminomethyltransferase GcvT [Candidatus Omnitrophota bacterium]